MILVPNTCLDLVPNHIGQKWCNAIQRQVALHFAPVWNVGDTIHYVGDSAIEKPRRGDRVVRIVRTSSEPGALGSHWFEDGLVVGEVGAQTCLDDGVEISPCLSHEILELLYDPYATLAFQVGRMMLAAEVCDRPEGSDPDYRIDGVTLENFSMPAAFNGSSGPYDFRGKAPSNEILPNGYQLQVDIGSGQWTQVTGALARRSKLSAGTHSRRALRMARAGADPSKLMLVAA